MSGGRSYPDPAELPPEQRPAVRLHRHEPDRLWPWVFAQHQVWVDVHGHEHEIESMSREYVRNLIAFCLERALLIRVICMEDEQLGCSVAGESPIDALPFVEEATGWLETTALMRALRRRLENAR